jgi:anti-sigma factor RsiW
MGRKETNQPLECGQCRDSLQEYLDGTLEKKISLQLFLHLRDCEECQQEHDQLQNMFQLMDSLPDLPLPEDFDQKILASVNIEGYRAMESIRRERVPVFLEEAFLPAAVRSRVTRLSGATVAVLALGAQFAFAGPEYLSAVAVVGLVPELLVRLQGIGRRAVLAQQTGS